MAVFDRLFAKLRQKDIPTRLQAVRDLPLSDRAALLSIAEKDPEPRVRKAAMKRLSEPLDLMGLAAAESDLKLREYAKTRANELLISEALEGGDRRKRLDALDRISAEDLLAQVAKESGDKEIAKAALVRLTDPGAVHSVAKRAKLPEARLQAVNRVEGVHHLERLALAEGDGKVAAAAMARIDDPKPLARIARDAKRKSVRRKAMERLKELGIDRIQTRKERRAEQLQVVTEVEVLADAFSDPAAEARMNEAERRWVDLGTDAAADLTRRLRRALREFRGKREEYLAARDAHLAPIAMRDAAERFCREVEALEGDAIEERLPEIRKAFVDLENPSSSLRKRFATIVNDAEGRLRRFREERKRRIDLLGKLQRLAEEADPIKAEKRLQELRARLESHLLEGEAALLVAKIEGRAEEVRQARKDLWEEAFHRCKEWETAAAGSDGPAVRRAQKEIRELTESLDNPPHELSRRLHEVERDLRFRCRELSADDGWKRWSNEKIIEDLCLEVESLVDEEDPAKASNRLRELRRRLNQVGPTPRGRQRELRQRFDETAEKIHRRASEHFKKLNQERQANLALKLVLCEEAEGLSDSTDYAATAEKLKTLQARWREIGPVPRKESKRTWKRFHEACDRFFKRRHDLFSAKRAEQEERLRLKEMLVERVEELMLSRDWDRTAQAMKQAQRDWKEIGATRRAADEQLWRRFRAACDRFFHRFHHREEVEAEDNLEQARAILSRIEGCQDAPDSLLALLSEFEQMGLMQSRESLEIRTELIGRAWRQAELNPEAFEGTRLDASRNRERRRELCDQAERLIEERRTPDLQNASIDRMVAELRKTMEDGAGSPSEQKASRKLFSAWERTLPMPDDPADRDLEKRFEEARAKLSG